MQNVNHLHPRHLRAYVAGWTPRPWKPLHPPLRPVPAGTSEARRGFTYAPARARLDRGERPCEQLKRQRLAWGMTRRELDAYLAKLASAARAGETFTRAAEHGRHL
jgi:hypothetical protein